MAFTQTHFLITSLILVFINNAVSLTFDFTKINSSTTAELVLQGADNSPAYISPSGIQVTPNEIGSVQSLKAGRATYVKQLHLWDNGSGELASFSTSFTFVIDSNDTNHGDGLTFFLAQNNANISTGGAMGLPVNMSTMEASSRFVAVEFDTYWNHVWDPREYERTNGYFGDHVGIDISSISVRYQSWFSNITGGGECQAWITYDSVSNNLSVSFTGYRNGEVVRQNGLFYIVDLRKELPEWVIFGFSAATGLSFQTNNVRSWTFNSSVLKVDENNQIPDTSTSTSTNNRPSRGVE